MLVKIYEILWMTIAIMVAILLILGNFTIMTLVVFGFVAFGMIFFGMMCVLPAAVHQQDIPADPTVNIITTQEKNGIFGSRHLPAR